MYKLETTQERNDLFMNRNSAKLLALMLALLTLTACGKKQGATTETTVSLENQTEALEMETLPYGVDFDDPVDLMETFEDETTAPAETTANTSGKSDTSKQDASKSDSTKAETTAPTEGKAETAAPTEAAASESCGCAYEAFLAMSGAEQEAYMNTFPSPLDFIAWCKEAEAEHASHTNVITVTGNELDLSDYID